jgi:hypothetical protein
MRKFLLAATILAPFAVAPAFAGGGSGGGMISGDGNLATTSAGSSATVGSVQGTAAQAKAAGNGGVIVGAVSANHTSVATTAAGQAAGLCHSDDSDPGQCRRNRGRGTGGQQGRRA